MFLRFRRYPLWLHQPESAIYGSLLQIEKIGRLFLPRSAGPNAASLGTRLQTCRWGSICHLWAKSHQWASRQCSAAEVKRVVSIRRRGRWYFTLWGRGVSLRRRAALLLWTLWQTKRSNSWNRSRASKGRRHRVRSRSLSWLLRRTTHPAKPRSCNAETLHSKATFHNHRVFTLKLH